jgi:hypothetical protein
MHAVSYHYYLNQNTQFSMENFGLASAWNSGRPWQQPFSVSFHAPTQGPCRPEHTSIEKKGGGGCPANARRRHQGKTVKSEKKDATPDLLIKSQMKHLQHASKDR